jgi:N6-adenosine-specific RNA methylase IME4
VSAGPVPSVRGGFGTIIVDPPRSFSDQGSRMATERAVGAGYRGMADEEILALPVDDRAAKNAHLYCWTTDAHLHLALHCIEAWRFRFLQTLVWGKRTSRSGGHRYGGGHYFRHVHELLLFAVRGQAPAARHDLISRFDAVNEGHSRKPGALHAIAEQMGPGPRLEMFARRRVAGWTTWGDQLPKGGA